MSDKDNLYKLQQNEVEHLKNKHEIRESSLKKEIESHMEQIQNHRKRNEEISQTLERERKSHHDEKDRLRVENENIVNENVKKDKNLESL